MPQEVYVVPGFGGSELISGVLTHWLNYSDFVLGLFGRLELAEDGVLAGGERGIELTAGPNPIRAPEEGLAGGYYATMVERLRTWGKERGWEVFLFPYDWRKTVISQGNRLALTILTRYNTSHVPATIVAHSMGGLVARAAWAYLSRINATRMIRRIITLGTPHQGTHHMLDELVAAPGTNAAYILLANSLAPPAFRLPLRIAYVRHWDLIDMSRLFLTWPGSYDLMPHLGSEDAADDPLRPLVWDPENWPPTWGFRQQHIDQSLNVFQPLMRSAASRPPASVLLCVAGAGYPTKEQITGRLVRSQVDTLSIVQDPWPMSSTSAGDGTVTERSATIQGYNAAVLLAQHGDLPSASLEHNRLLEWIEEEMTGPVEPPETPQPGDAPFAATIPWPAASQALRTDNVEAGCVHGLCQC